MWQKIVADYFRFSKKDRVGILVLIALICIVVLLPSIWPPKKSTMPSPEDIAAINAFNASIRKKDSTHRLPGQFPATATSEHYAAPAPAPARLFYFDPNNLDAAGWASLGIRDKTAATILHYLEKRGQFKKPEDLKKVYGLRPADYDRLLPFVRIPARPAAAASSVAERKLYPSFFPATYQQKAPALTTVVDINSADTTALIALPGIGSKLAARIVTFREKLGGFYSVAQLAETYGLPDSSFQQLLPRLRCDPAPLRQLPVNTADANTLKQHPYIRWQLANAIVAYRNEHRAFSRLEDLQQISLVTPALFARLRPYLLLE